MKKKILTFVIFGVSILMIVLGVMQGEVGTVFKKAVNICMECIGIG